MLLHEYTRMPGTEVMLNDIFSGTGTERERERKRVSTRERMQACLNVVKC